MWRSIRSSCSDIGAHREILGRSDAVPGENDHAAVFAYEQYKALVFTDTKNTTVIYFEPENRRGMSDREGAGDTSGASRETNDTRPRFLFPIDGENASDLIPLVRDFVTDADGELLVASLVTLPEQTPHSMPQPKREAEHQLARFIRDFKQQCDEPLPINRVMKVGRNRDHMLKTIVQSYQIDTVITEDHPRTGLRSMLGIKAVDEKAIGEKCDTLIATRTDCPDEFDSILVPIARGPHSGLAIDTGLALARQNDASLDLLHVFRQGDDEAEQQGKEVLERGLDRASGFESVETTLRAAEEVPAAVNETSQSYEVVVLGAPREGLIQQFALGTIPDSVSASTDGTVVIAHHGGAEESRLDRWL